MPPALLAERSRNGVVESAACPEGAPHKVRLQTAAMRPGREWTALFGRGMRPWFYQPPPPLPSCFWSLPGPPAAGPRAGTRWARRGCMRPAHSAPPPASEPPPAPRNAKAPRTGPWELPVMSLSYVLGRRTTWSRDLGGQQSVSGARTVMLFKDYPLEEHYGPSIIPTPPVRDAVAEMVTGAAPDQLAARGGGPGRCGR